MPRTSREQLNVLAEEAGKLGKQSKEDILGFVKAADQINVALDELYGFGSLPSQLRKAYGGCRSTGRDDYSTNHGSGRCAGFSGPGRGNVGNRRFQADYGYVQATSVTKEYNVQNTTVQAGLDKAKKRVKEMAVELGEKLMPIMRHVLSSTTILLKVLSAIVDFCIKYKTAILTVTVAIAGYWAAVKLQYLWSLRFIAVAKLKAAAVAVENAMLAASILKHKVLRGEITATAAAQTYFNKVLKMNPMGAVIAATTVLIGLYVKFATTTNSAARAQQRLKEIQEAADRSVANEISQIEMLRKTIEDNTVSIGNRRDAIEKLQEIVPDYHASLSDEGVLIGHNSQVLDIYVKQLKNMAMIKEAISRQTDLEFRYKKFSDETPNNIMNAYFNEQVNGMSENEAIAAASASPTGYRAWKKQVQALDEEKKQLNNIIDSRTLENQELSDQAKKLMEEGRKGNGGGNTPTIPTDDDKSKQNRFKAEKDWKAKEEALNKIAYATGQKNYEQYQQRILAIETEYQQKILDRADLSEQERLDAQAAFYEAQRKQADQERKVSVEQENQSYNEMIALQKQRFIDGEVEQEVYQQTLEILELEHLKRMVSLYKEGTSEYLQAQKAYQDKLIADQKKRQQEAEAAEKKHQDQLKKLKEEYFGDNKGERMGKYMSDLEGLKQVYQMEVQAAGDNAKEKLRIEEAFQKAKKALRKKYGIDEMEDNKNFLEEWTADMQEWLQSDMGKAVTGSLLRGY